MGAIKSLVQPDMQNDKKPLPLVLFFRKPEGLNGFLTFYGSDGLQTMQYTQPCQQLF
jgi:hypothetical protein